VSGFSDEIAELDDAVEETLLDPAEYFPAGVSGEIVPVMVSIDFPREIDRAVGQGFTRQRPTMRLRRSRVPQLKERALFRHKGKFWSVAEAPSAIDDGAWWVFEVQSG